MNLENLNLKLNKNDEISDISSRKKFLETVKPVAIGGQIVGSNHFDEYNIKIDSQGKAIITSIKQ